MQPSAPANGQPRLSTQALRTYDQHGEDAMLSFVLRNESPESQRPGGPEDRYVLQDGSALWFEQPGGRYQDGETHRSRPMSRDAMPRFRSNTPVFPGPSSWDVLVHIASLGQTPREPSRVLWLAPGLDEAVHQAIREISHRLGREQTTCQQAVGLCAQLALRKLPGEEFRRLAEAASQEEREG